MFEIPTNYIKDTLIFHKFPLYAYSIYSSNYKFFLERQTYTS